MNVLYDNRSIPLAYHAELLRCILEPLKKLENYEAGKLTLSVRMKAWETQVVIHSNPTSKSESKYLRDVTLNTQTLQEIRDGVDVHSLRFDISFNADAPLLNAEMHFALPANLVHETLDHQAMHRIGRMGEAMAKFLWARQLPKDTELEFLKHPSRTFYI